MATMPPMPSPPLDGVPPSPPGLAAKGGPNPQISQLTPDMELTGSLQVVQLSLEAASLVGKILTELGEVLPVFAPVASSMIEQLRGGLKIALQQGSSGLELGPQQPMVPQGAMPPATQTPGEPQAPLPPMQSGF